MQEAIAAFVASLDLADKYHSTRDIDRETWLFVAGDVTLYGHTYTADESYPITEDGRFKPELLDTLRALLETSAESARACCEEDARNQAWAEYLERLKAA